MLLNKKSLMALNMVLIPDIRRNAVDYLPCTGALAISLKT